MQNQGNKSFVSANGDNPLSPPSNNENPLAKDWNRLAPGMDIDNQVVGGGNGQYPDHLGGPSSFSKNEGAAA